MILFFILSILFVYVYLSYWLLEQDLWVVICELGIAFIVAVTVYFLWQCHGYLWLFLQFLFNLSLYLLPVGVGIFLFILFLPPRTKRKNPLF